LITLWPHAKTTDFAKAIVTARKPSFRSRMAQLGVFDAGSKVEGVTQRAAAGAKGWLSNPFAKASETNRAVGYALGEIEGKRMGLTGDNLHRRAMDWAKQTEFDNSQWDVPDILSSPVGSTIGQYKGFAMKNLENAGRTLKYKATDTPLSWAKRVGKFGAAVGVQGGIKATGATLAMEAAGIPVYKVVQGLTGAITRTGVERDEAEKMAQVMVFGAPAAAGFDVSASVALLDEPFGNSLGEKALNSLGGTNIAAAVQIGKAGKEYFGAESPKEKQGAIDSLKKLAPYSKTYDMTRQMIENDGRGAKVQIGRDVIDLTPEEAVGRALGFTPLKQTLHFQAKDEGFDKREVAREGRTNARRESVTGNERFKQAPEGYDIDTYQKAIIAEADRLAKSDAEGNRQPRQGDEELIFHNAQVALERNKFMSWIKEQDFYKGLSNTEREAFEKATVAEFGRTQLQPRQSESVNESLEAGRNKFLDLLDDFETDRNEFVDRIVRKAKVNR
jgi:hypothetical protein